MFHLVLRMRLAAVCAIVGLSVLGGCASTGDPRDPLEPINRGVYQFNEGVDTMLLKPAAEVYQGLLPGIVRTGISNFFSNLNDVTVAINNLLQGKFSEAASDGGRLLINTTAGLFGLFDVATPAGLEKHDEDFGQTLGWWGVGDGPYLVLPILGPRTTRDTASLYVDWQTAPITHLDSVRERNSLLGLRLVSGRAELLGASRLLSVAALDPYEFVRDAYLQRRRNLIHDGNPPREAREKDAAIDLTIWPESIRLPMIAPAASNENTVDPQQPASRADPKDGLSQANNPPGITATAEAPQMVRVWLH